MKNKLSVVLVMIVLLSLAAVAPLNAKAPLVGEMDLEFDVDWPGPQQTVEPSWVGTVTFEEGEYGMAFFPVGTGKSFEEDPPFKGGPPKVHFFEEVWRIYELGDGFSYTVDDFTPGPLVMEGSDTGITNIKNSKYHMNGIVDIANGPFEEWIGRSVHMRGLVEWAGPGVPQYGDGTFRIN